MKAKAVVVLTVILLFSFGFRLSAKEDSSVLLREAKQFDLAIAKQDLHALDHFLLDDYVLTTSSSRVLTKKEVLEGESSPDLKYETNESSDVDVHVYGDTAVVTAVLHQKGVEAQKPFDYSVRYSDTWVKTPDGWRQLAGHASPYSK